MTIEYEKRNIKAEADSEGRLVGLRFDLHATTPSDSADASWHKVFDLPQNPVDSYSEEELDTLCEVVVAEKGLHNFLANVIARRTGHPASADADALLATPVVPQAPTDAEQRKIWMAEIDDAVAQTYTRFGRFEMEYTKREEAAKAYKQAGYTGEPTHWITRFADNIGMTYPAATDLILAQAAALRTAFEQLAQLRMDKYKVLNAATQEDAIVEFNIIMSQRMAIDGGLK